MRETSLVLVPFAVAALVFTRRLRGRTRTGVRVLAGSALAVSVATAIAPMTALPTPMAFSPGDYVLGALLTPDVRVERDVVLDPARPALSADVFHAPGPPPHPFVVLVHGGSWRGGDKGEIPDASRHLAAAGFTVVDVRYALAPSSPFPKGIADVKCLLGRVRERAGALGIDPARGALLGRSAGGQIALLAAYSAGDPRIPPSCAVADEGVRAVVALYAPADLVWGHANPAVPDIIRGTESIELYVGGPPDAVPETYRLAAPSSWLDRDVPETLLVHGAGDQLVSPVHSRRLAADLARHGRAHRLLEVPLGEHGMDARPGGVSEQAVRRATLDFLEAHLR